MTDIHHDNDQGLDPDPNDNEDDFIKKARTRYREARDHNAKWKKKAIRAYEFWAGRQWDEDISTALENAGRAAVVMNRIRPRVSAVVGMEINNRKEIRYSPREESDQAVIDLINRASEWSRDQAETEDHETQMFQDCLVTGMGWTETAMDYEENIDGIAVARKRNPIAYDWDPIARQSNLADMEFYFHSEDISKKQFKDLFPGQEDKAKPNALGQDDLFTTEEQPHDDEDAKYYPNEAPAYPGAEQRGKRETVRLVKYSYVEKVLVWRVMMPDGSMRAVEPDDADDMADQLMTTQGRKVIFEEFDDNKPLREGFQDLGGENTTLVLPYVKQLQRRHREAWITGETVLEDELAPCPHTFSDHCITGWRDENEGTFFGMVDGLIDPQEWANKFFSQAIFIYTVNPKGGGILKKSAVDNPDDVEAKWASPDSIIWATEGADLDRDFRERKPGQYPPDLDKLTAFAIDSLPALDGLTPEIMGQVSRDQPGILENMRKQASMTVLAPVFNSKARYHKRQGRTLLHFISQYFTDTQLARIHGPDMDPQALQTLREMDVRNYDVLVESAPASPNAKEYNLTVMFELMRQVPDVASPLLPLLIKNTPLEGAMQEEILASIKAITDPMSSPQVQQMQQQLQQMQQENEQLKSKQELEMTKIQMDAMANEMRVTQKTEEANSKSDFNYEQLEQAMDIKIMEMENRIQTAIIQAQAQTESAKQNDNDSKPS